MKVFDKRFMSLLVIFIFIWAWVYADALISMEMMWRKSDTFAHGYFILPISMWLIWRDKDYLLNSKVQLTLLPIPFITVALIAWLFAFAGDINVLGQISAVTVLICLLWLLLGNALTWRYKFPLAYLIFAVPMGEGLIPVLQDITAWFTVEFLKLNGIPVFRDGLYIQIPSGMFEVAVACSGIRYLLACVAVGSLFAYLSFNSFKKQILFLMFSLILPIIANGIRAYGIVAIAYYSDMEYAVGADHLIYGWVFFAFVIALMFYVGGKYTDNNVTLSSGHVFNSHPIAKKRTIAALIALLGVMVISRILINNITLVQTPDIPKPSIIATTGLTEVKKSNWGITYQQGLQRSHFINENKLEIFRAVYAHKQSIGELIGWGNDEFNHNRWTVITSKQVQINEGLVNYLLIRDVMGNERFVVYWFNINGEILLNKYQVKFKQTISSYLAPESTAEIIALSMSNTSEQEFLANVTAFSGIQELNRFR